MARASFLPNKFSHIFGRTSQSNKLRQRVNNRLGSGNGSSALQMEPLEERRLLAVAETFVNDNWFLAVDADFSGFPSPGDTVDNRSDTEGAPTIVKTFGVDAFPNINAGINNTLSGGKVNVLVGNYAEDVVIANAGVTVEGNIDGDTTIIGQGGLDAAVNIFANNVTVKGFTIQGTNDAGVLFGPSNIDSVVSNNRITGFAGPGRDAIRINTLVNGVEVKSNDITSNNVGVRFLANANNVVVSDNFFDLNFTDVKLNAAFNGTDNQVIYNSMANTGSGNAVDNQSATTINVRANWWGDPDGANVAGASNTVGPVQAQPRLSSGTDNDIDGNDNPFGFVATNTLLTTVVDDNSLPAAINVARTGARIVADPNSTHDDDLVVEKAVTIAGDNLTINGSLNLKAAGAKLDPGASPGTVTVTKNATFGPGSQFFVELNGEDPGTEHDVLDLPGVKVGDDQFGRLILNGASLGASLNFPAGTVPQTGESFVIIPRDQSVPAVQGIFSGAPEGAIFEITDPNTKSTFTAQITYKGRKPGDDPDKDGRSVILTLQKSATIIVDDDFAGSLPGTDPDGDDGPAAIFGYSAFADIESAVANVASNGQILINPGNYETADAILINQPVKIIGSGSGEKVDDGNSIVTSMDDDEPVFIVDASGSAVDDRLMIKDLRIIGKASGGQGLVEVVGEVDNDDNDPRANITLDNLNVRGNTTGASILFRNDEFNSLTIANSTVTGSNNGIHLTGSIRDFNNLTISNSTITGNRIHGIFSQSPDIDNLQILGGTLEGNSTLPPTKGAANDNNTPGDLTDDFFDPGSPGGGPLSGDIVLTNFTGDVTISDVDLIVGTEFGPGTIDLRADTNTVDPPILFGEGHLANILIQGPEANRVPSGEITINNLTVLKAEDNDATIRPDSAVFVRFYQNADNGITIRDSNFDATLDKSDVAFSSIGINGDNPTEILLVNNKFTQRSPSDIRNFAAAGVDATVGNIFTKIVDGATQNANNFEIEDRIVHRMDNVGQGFVEVVPNNAFVTNASGSIANATTVAGQGFTINVNNPGNLATETVVIGKTVDDVAQSVTLTGVGGIKAGPGAGGLFINENSILAPGLNGAGVFQTNALTMQPGSTLKIELNGPTPTAPGDKAGFAHDQVKVTGVPPSGGGTATVDIFSLNDKPTLLDLSLGFTPDPNEQFTIIDIVEPGLFANGEFVGLPEGTTFQMTDPTGKVFIARINYRAGTDNNDVVITVLGPNAVFVDDDFAGTPIGADPDGPGPATSFGFDSFATIQGGLGVVNSGGTVQVAAGIYNENVVIPQTASSARLIGAGVGQSIIRGIPQAAGGSATVLVEGFGSVIEGFSIEKGSSGNRHGVRFFATADKARLADSEVTGHERAVQLDIGGAQDGADEVTIERNVLAGPKPGGDNPPPSWGVVLRGGQDKVLIQNNIITGQSASVRVTSAIGEKNVLRENSLTDGIDFPQPFQDPDTQRNLIFDTDQPGFDITDPLEAIPDGTDALNASFNWFGETDDAKVVEKKIKSTLGNSATSRIDFSPFLNTGDTSGAFGFQGDFSFLHVTPLGSTQTDQVGEAVGSVIAGGTVNIQNGTYRENDIALNKPIIVRGQNRNDVVIGRDNFDPDKQNGDGFVVSSENVTVRNLTLDGVVGTGRFTNAIEVDSGNPLIESVNIRNANVGVRGDNTNFTLTDSNFRSVGIGVDGRGLTAGTMIDDNTFDLIIDPATERGVQLYNSQGLVTIVDNQINAAGRDTGIFLVGNPEGTVDVFRNNLFSSGSIVDGAGTGAGVVVTENVKQFINKDAANLDSFAKVRGNNITGFRYGVELLRNTVGADADKMVHVVVGGPGEGDPNTIAGATDGVRVFEGDGGANGYLSFAEIIRNGPTIGGNTNGVHVVGGAATIIDNAITGNVTGVRASAGGAALLEGNDLRSNTFAGLLVTGAAFVDAGQQDTQTNFTGLGTSLGGNDFSNYFPGAGRARAIVNTNTGPGYSLPGPQGIPLDTAAEGNLFFSTTGSAIEEVIDHDVDDFNFGFVDFTFTNATPVVNAGADANVLLNVPFVQSGSFSDPNQDIWTATVNYGDGSGTQALPLDGKTFQLNHTYTTGGEFTVTVTVNDNAGGIGSDTLTVTVGVDNQAPTVTLDPVASPRTTPVDVIVARFSEPVNGVDLSDFNLDKANDGQGNLLNPNSHVVVKIDDLTYEVRGLSNVTAGAGNYNFRINAGAGITDVAGNALANKDNALFTVQEPQAVGPTVTVDQVVPDPRLTPVDTLTIRFSDPVVGFDFGDLNLDLDGDGAGNLLNTDDHQLVQLDDTTYLLTGLTGVTSAPGNYNFRVNGPGSPGVPDPGITDLQGNPLQGKTNELWTILDSGADLDPPTVEIEDIASPRSTAVDTIDFTFSEPVVGVDITDLNLDKASDGKGNLIDPTVHTLTQVDATTYRISGLANVTAGEGNYNFRVNGGPGIADEAGNPLARKDNALWTVSGAPDTTAPTVSVDAVVPDPTPATVDTLTIRFSEAVLNFDLSDLNLDKSNDGAGNLIDPATHVLTQIDPTTYELSGLSNVTGGAGRYNLRVNPSDITDSAGNGLAAKTNEVWDKIDQVSPPPALDGMEDILDDLLS